MASRSTGRHGAIMIGSAGEITDKLLDAAKALDLDRIFAQVDWGGLPPGTWSGSPSPATPPRSHPPSAVRPPRCPRRDRFGSGVGVNALGTLPGFVSPGIYLSAICLALRGSASGGTRTRWRALGQLRSEFGHG
jgi:hypothetical protein